MMHDESLMLVKLLTCKSDSTVQAYHEEQRNVVIVLYSLRGLIG